MKTQESKSKKQVNLTGLHYYQIDYVKLKLYSVDEKSIKWSSFKAHPTIKKRYKLNVPTSKLFTKNFDMYIDKGNNITIDISIPYLLKNHNYLATDVAKINFVLHQLQCLTGLELKTAVVLEIEYGAFKTILIESTQYIRNIIGHSKLDLLKSTTYMKLFGSGNTQYKVYDAVKNSKRKKTYSRGNLPQGKLIKHEIRLKRPKKLNNKILIVKDLTDRVHINMLRSLFEMNKAELIFKRDHPHKFKVGNLTQVLYETLKIVEQDLETPIVKIVTDVIDGSELSPSQKSKRKKSLSSLETTYNTQLQKR
jgi:hypothetical protein